MSNHKLDAYLHPKPRWGNVNYPFENIGNTFIRLPCVGMAVWERNPIGNKHYTKSIYIYLNWAINGQTKHQEINMWATCVIETGPYAHIGSLGRSFNNQSTSTCDMCARIKRYFCEKLHKKSWTMDCDFCCKHNFCI